ncbi:MAG: cysteine methyltransferase [Pseudopedobacter saltans]|uniref:methylated-DNA--[protein]-cysteine S-methyltransferase n=1 Tax=Pseudopedobacter saltans TaxID=151895 RepID=A0A2W5HF23_9SPHI|nr:MAG: cysteine methyltransferase [Pseudopedobacter saltans]
MEVQDNINFDRIAQAIAYIKTNFKAQPSLDEIAKQVHMSPFHFQRMFLDWAGTTPKKFLQYISLQHAKSLLTQKQASLLDTTIETGLSATSRLHDLFVNIEGMTPAEFKSGGINLVINYSFSQSLFGNLIVASTRKGVCHIAFHANEDTALQELQCRFPNADFQLQNDEFQNAALAVFQNNKREFSDIKLHLKGTAFQLNVWEALLKIPMGQLSTYSAVAAYIGHPKASRAVGSAIGSNPIAFIIPCHRVIQNSGLLGGYMWGTDRKSAIIGWESAQTIMDGDLS